MTTETLERPDTKTDDGTGNDDPEVFHYVKKDQIARSAVEGTHVVALCGETLPVTKTPKKGSPVCPECQRVLETLPK